MPISYVRRRSAHCALLIIPFTLMCGVAATAQDSPNARDLESDGADADDFDDEDYVLVDERDGEDDINYSFTPRPKDGIRDAPDIPLVTAAQPARAAPIAAAPVQAASDQPQAASAVPGRATLRSFGGHRVADRDAPWQAQIYYPKIAPKWAAEIAAGVPAWRKQHFCGGAVIAPGWVVTAAHCIDADMMRAGYRIRLGQENIAQPGGWTYRIDRVIISPDNASMYQGDIALIKYSDDTAQANPPAAEVRPIALLRGGDPPATSPVTGYGWGRTGDTGAVANAVLLRVPLAVIARSDCVAKPNMTAQKIHAGVLCAAAPGAKTCRGDSGGPLVNAAGQLVGIVSWGSDRCADDSAPGVYTRIGAYATWIDRETGGAAR